MPKGYRNVNLTGMRIGRLLVDHFSGTRKNGYNIWVCLCDCGNTTEVRSGSLLSGDTRSCGCLRTEAIQSWTLEPGKASFNDCVRKYKRAARKKGIVFDLSEEMCCTLFTGMCKYCGQPPDKPHKRKKYGTPFYSNGIDRVDSNEGYVIENCVSCCSVCNYAKRDLTLEEFLIWLDRVTAYRISQTSGIKG